jgi:hypothetical protein
MLEVLGYTRGLAGRSTRRSAGRSTRRSTQWASWGPHPVQVRYLDALGDRAGRRVAGSTLGRSHWEKTGTELGRHWESTRTLLGGVHWGPLGWNLGVTLGQRLGKHLGPGTGRSGPSLSERTWASNTGRRSQTFTRQLETLGGDTRTRPGTQAGAGRRTG